MNTVQRIAKNTVALTVADIFTKVLSVVLIVYATRFLGDVGFGKYTFAMSFCAIFAIFADFGLNTLLIREIAGDKIRTGEYLGSGTAIKLTFSGITFFAIYLAINLLKYPADTKTAVYIIGLYFITGSLAGLYRCVFNAYERMEFEAFARTLQQSIIVVIGVSALYLGYGLFGLVMAFLLGSIINLLYSVILVSTKFTKPKIQINISLWRDLLKEALPFGITGVLGVIYFRIDVVMLSLMKGDAVVGWYGVAYTLVEALMFIPGAFAGALFPVFSSLFRSSDDAIRITYEKSLNYLYVAALPIAVGVTILADKIILIAFRQEFSNSVMALQILIWALLFMFLNYGLGSVLGAIKRQQILMFNALACVIVNIVLNLLLIPSLSYIGASIATVITEFTLCALSFYFVSKYLYTLPVRKYITKPLIAVFCMGAYVYLLKDITIFLIAPTAALIYFGLLYFIKGFDDQDITLFKTLIRKPLGGEVE